MSKYTTTQLDSLLVPTFLRGLTASQQATAVTGSSSQAVNFRRKSNLVLQSALNAFKARGRGTCSANFTVPYTIPAGVVTISWCSMADYFCHLQGSPASGFPYIFSKAREYERRLVKCCPKGSYGGVK